METKRKPFGFFACALSCALSLSAAAQGPAVNEKLLTALRNGDAQAVRLCLRQGADANAWDEDGLTPLMYAAMYADAACVKLLLSKGADPKAKSHGEMTALMLAVGDVRKVRLLLAQGAEVNAKSKQGHTALTIAAGRAGSLEVIRVLLANGASLDNGNSLGGAARSGDFQVMKFLLEKGADPNSKTAGGPPPTSEKRLNVRNNEMAAGDKPPLLGLAGNLGMTPLMYAAQARNTAGIKFLLANGADVNAVNNFQSGVTALIVAAQLGDLEAVNLLLKKGAAVNARHASGYTALMYAAASESDDAELIKALLAHGADARLKANDGETASTLAGKKGKTAIIRLLESASAKH